MSKLVPLDTRSIMKWKGIKSQKFEGGRVAFKVKDNIWNLDSQEALLPGKRHFTDKYGKVKLEKPGLRTYKHHNKQSNKTHSVSELQAGKKRYKVKYKPKHPRPEMKHLNANPSSCWDDP